MASNMDDINMAQSLHQFLYTEPILPPFLEGKEKWEHVVNNTDTSEKFEMLIYRLLDEEYVTPLDFYKILKKLEKDILDKHKDEQICCCVGFIECILDHLVELIKHFDKSWKKGEWREISRSFC